MTPNSNNVDEVSLKESKIVLMEVQENKEYLELREKELESIKKVSAEVLSITNHMKVEVAAQGQMLTGIEDNVIIVKDNMGKAENEIKDAEKMTRSSSKKIVCLFLLICFAVVSIVTIVALIAYR